jgi:hypothetical protein
MGRTHTGPAQRLARSRSHSGAAHHRLAGANRATKDRLAGNRRACRSTGPGGAGRRGSGTRLLAEALLQIGARRNRGPRRRCETGTARRTRRNRRVWGQSGACLARRRRAARQRRTGNAARGSGRTGCDDVRGRLRPWLRRSRRCGSRLRAFGLRRPWTLWQWRSGAGRLGRLRKRASGNGDGPVRSTGRSERWMQRSSST